MTDQKKSLYPTPDTPEVAIAEGVSKLPIESKNELIGILNTHANSVLRKQRAHDVIEECVDMFNKGAKK